MKSRRYARHGFVHRWLLVGWIGVGLLVGCPPAVGHSDEPPAEHAEFFEKKIRPLLVEHCYQCHSAKSEKLLAGLYVDSLDGLLAGGDSGPSIVPGKPDESLLIEAIRYESFEMPPTGKLSQENIDLLVKWVEMGAPWPSHLQGPNRPKPAPEFDLQQRVQSHWSWKPVKNPTPPVVQDESWQDHPIDRFIFAELANNGLHPAAQADRRTLIRRLYFDLIGLPPTPKQIDAYLQDRSANATEKLVDQLLASPQFGERWGRHWLDLVRYAESRGHEFDNDAANAFQYRDYVIRALNLDLPYDQFVTEHIAGDLLQQPRLNPKTGANESILATGFWFLGEWVHSPVDTRKDETDRFDNMIDVMSKTFLGLTVSCARCHDHKFDAISTRDYYSLYGFLQSSNYRQVRFESIETNRKVAHQLEQFDRQSQKVLREALASVLRPGTAQLPSYLEGAVEIAAANQEDPQPADAQRRLIESVAADRQLDPDRLQHWLDHLDQHRDNSQDPIGVLYNALQQTGSVNSTVAANRAISATKTGTWGDRVDPDQIIIDYARLTADQYMQDGYSFGLAPVSLGTVLLDSNSEIPGCRVARWTSARRDPAWKGLNSIFPKPTNQRNRLRRFPRSGQTLRTPTFEVKSGKISYLVRGGCYAVACVDSHRLVDGPLHQETIKEIQPHESTEPRWVTHSLEKHRGHRIHIEFTARKEDDVEILMVIQGPPPRQSANHSPDWSWTEEVKSRSTDSWGPRVTERFVQAVKQLESGEFDSSHPSHAAAELADWMVQHLDLFAEATAARRVAYQRTVQSIQAERNQIVEQIARRSHCAMAMMDGSSEDDFVLIRGNHKNVGEAAPRRFLEALGGHRAPVTSAGSGRLQLAQQLTADDNPYFSRVIVNRIWHHLMGRGIVPTVDDFGELGTPPTHPELLDHLASRFLQDGRSIKRMIKYVVTSRTYQMANHAVGNAQEIDPGNRYFHSRPPRRLQGEIIRDAMLSVSGRLDPSMFGPSVPVHLTPFMDGRGRPAKSGPLDGDGRRSIYLAVRRNFLSPMMLAFDTPSPFSTMGRRNVSNVPAQALILMNDPFVVQQARRWAESALAGEPTSTVVRIQKMYETAFARLPTAAELEQAQRFVETQAAARQSDPHDVTIWADLAHVLFNTKEFIFVR